MKWDDGASCHAEEGRPSRTPSTLYDSLEQSVFGTEVDGVCEFAERIGDRKSRRRVFLRHTRCSRGRNE